MSKKREIKQSKFGSYYTKPFTKSRDIVVVAKITKKKIV